MKLLLRSLLLLAVAIPLQAEITRDAEAAEKAAQGEPGGDMKRPAHLPDLTRGGKLNPEKDVQFNLGPTGIIGRKNGGFKGDQVFVETVLPGSPAAGVILPGDVLLGIGGVNFAAGGHLGVTMGNAIIAAETEAGRGRLSMRVWRDRNYVIRNASRDIAGTDLDELFKEAESGGGIFDWKDRTSRDLAVENIGTDKYPVNAVLTNVTLQLKVMGTYSETSPWDCPVVERIREDAYRVVEARFVPDERGRVRGSTLGIMALVASGKPEHRQIARDWVRSKHGKVWHPDKKVQIQKSQGMMSWHLGFWGLECALYYEATRDEFVLPALKEFAVKTAMGQNGGGSWGHTFAYPSFNAGKLHGQNPGYGAMNNAGGRCFFLLALAQQLGIEHPEIDDAVRRGRRFFGTFVDKGCIPYGYHGPWPSDDSNGKNYGPAYAFKVLGDDHAANYYAQLSTHASFTRRGGHASDYFWHYTPLSANLAGDEGTVVTMRNMRWWYTLARRHDGSFVVNGEQWGFNNLRDPTATHLMHYAIPLRQLLVHGKDPSPSLWKNEGEMEALLLSARAQITDTKLLERCGTPWKERSSDELLVHLGHFYPNMRRALAKELGARYQAGEKVLLPKLLRALNSEAPREREGACQALLACGEDAVLANLSGFFDRLDDPSEIVRMQTLKVIDAVTEVSDPRRQKALLTSAADNYDPMSADNGNVRTAVKEAMFPRRGEHGIFGTAPFESGLDEVLVRSGLETLITMDPGGVVPGKWNRDTLLRLAGPVTFVADEMQLNDAMFGFARTRDGRALLLKHGYREAIEGDASNLLKRHALERDMRLQVGFKLPYVTPKEVKKSPGLYRDLLDPLRKWLQDDPVATISEKVAKGKPPIITSAVDLIRMIEADKSATSLPSIGPDVFKQFQARLDEAGPTREQIAICRSELANPGRRNEFRQIASMTVLRELLGSDALADITPYLGHERRRVREHAHQVAVEAVKEGASGPLIRQFATASGDNAAAMLDVVREARVGAALPTVREALKHADPPVRRAAVRALFSLSGDPNHVFDVLASANDPETLWGCEQALLSRRDDAAHAHAVRSRSLAMLPGAAPLQQRSLAWILAQLGGPNALAAIQQAAAQTENQDELDEFILALSYAPEREADRVLLELAKVDEAHLDAVLAHAVRRMVGRNGLGDVSDSERLDFATPLLRMKHEPRLITFLGNVHTARSANLLLEVMQKGSTEVAARSIVTLGEGLPKPGTPAAEATAEALTEVIEFIEVTQLRGGIEGKDWRSYPKWKALQARAGKALLKLHKPEKAPLKGFDDLDLDF